MIPGSNLLGEAFDVLGTQIISYRNFQSRIQNSQFQFISQFSAPADLESMVQRVPREQYVAFGLEWQRNYVKVFAPYDMIDLDRDHAGDQFIYRRRLFQLESQGTWFEQDGWAVCLAVDIGPGILPIDNNGNYAFPN